MQRQLRAARRDARYFVPLADERRRNAADDLLTGLVQAEHEGSQARSRRDARDARAAAGGGQRDHDHADRQRGARAARAPGRAEAPARRPGAAARRRSRRCCASRRRCSSIRAASSATQSSHGVDDPPRTTLVLCWLGSANRDERLLRAPGRASTSRARRTRTSRSGSAPHYCLGANLARLEARVALDALLARTRSFERTGDELLPLHPSPVFAA